uniref:Uncharacterized protein n=1 Tax=Lepeophtheirus salmonis TaxID=72036 RepID=A0A0K2TVS9_LEPSM
MGNDVPHLALRSISVLLHHQKTGIKVLPLQHTKPKSDNTQES